jgi:hypothetical protein
MPLHLTDESESLKICLQYGSITFLTIVFKFWCILLQKNLNTFEHVPKCVGATSRLLVADDAPASL